MKVLFGVSALPYTQVNLTQLPFNKTTHVAKAIDSIEGSQCKYTVGSQVTSDDEMAGSPGKWKYDIDFSNVQVQAEVANNAYEAFSWDPVMFVYPSQKAEAKRHPISKVIRVTLKTAGSNFYCATNITRGTPPYCTSLKAFEIHPSVTSVAAVLDAAKNLKASACHSMTVGVAAGSMVSTSVVNAYPIRGKWAPSEAQCAASGQTDADDSIIFSGRKVLSNGESACVAKSITVNGNMISTVETCGSLHLNRKIKILSDTAFILNAGDKQFETKYVKCQK